MMSSHRANTSGSQLKTILVCFYKTTDFNPNYYYPLSLHYLKAYAEKELAGRITVAVQNFSVEADSGHVVDELLKDDPDVIGFSCYVWNTREVLEICHLLKRLKPALRVVLGGPQVTSTADAVLSENPWVDAIVRGEGEQTFAELLKFYLQGDLGIETIDGISYRVDGAVKANPPRPLLPDLDDIPSPFSDGIDDKSREILLETQRGCPFECGFCTYHKNYKSVRYFSLERIKKDLDYLIGSGVKRLYLVDPTFNLEPKRAKEILRYIASINKNTTINTELRAELLDRETIDLLEKAGVEFLEIGLQSANPATLKIIGRETSFTKFEEGIKLLEKSRIQYVIQLIIGLPGDDLSSFKKSMDYVLSLAPDKCQIFDLQLLPGSALYDNADRHGMLFHRTPPHLVIQNQSFSYRDMLRARRLAAEAYLMYPRNYGSLADLSGLRPSELIEKWIAWREARIDVSFGEFERWRGIRRLRLFSRFIQELLGQDDASVARRVYRAGRCNLLVLQIVSKYLKKSVRRVLRGR